MKRLSVIKRPANIAVMLDFKSRLRYLYDVRAIHISKMSGYPAAIHSIGRLQKMIDTSSFKNLLSSICKIQQIASITAEVIDTLEGTKTDRYQLNRTEIVTYVTNMVSKFPDVELSTDEIDVIANLIISFEANPANWILQSSEVEENLHLRFYGLYKEVLLTDDPGGIAAFSPLESKIVNFADLDHVKVIAKAKRKKGAKADEESDEAKVNEQMFQDACTIYQMAACRLLDHVYQLLLDKDIWYSFVTPRTKADVATNIARSQSLRALFTYCQSLLTYYQFFTIEMFLSSYEIIQQWITHFPPMEATVVYELENVIRKHDLLGARADVGKIISSFSASAKADLDAIAFPSEFLAKFGLSQSIKSLTKKASEYAFGGDLTSIESLNKPQYIPLLSGTSIGVLDAIPSMTAMVITHKIVSHEVSHMMSGLVPVLARGSRKSDIEAVRAMNIRAGMPFEIPTPAAYQIEAGVAKGVEEGQIMLDALSPQFSFHYHQYLRDNMAFKMKTDDVIRAGYDSFVTRNIVDYDRARELKTILGTSWRTLIPIQWAGADRTFTPDEMGTTFEKVKQLIEDISGTSYDIFIRELTLPHVQRMFATVVSSFATLYIKQGENSHLVLNSDMRVSKEDQQGLVLVEGYGRPYGTVYPALASQQGEIDDKTKLIRLGMGAYLRIHKVVPIVIDELRIDPAFYSQRPVMFFSSNSGIMKVDRWVLGDPMLNFALAPVADVSIAPPITITPKHVYLTTRLYVNYDFYYKPAVPEQAREKTSVAITVKDWKDDRHQFFLEYRTLGSYATVAAVAEEGSGELLVNATKKIEKLIEEGAAAANEDAKGAGAIVKKVINEAEGGIADIHSKNTDKPEGSKEQDISI